MLPVGRPAHLGRIGRAIYTVIGLATRNVITGLNSIGIYPRRIHTFNMNANAISVPPAYFLDSFLHLSRVATRYRHAYTGYDVDGFVHQLVQNVAGSLRTEPWAHEVTVPSLLTVFTTRSFLEQQEDAGRAHPASKPVDRRRSS